MVLRNWTVLCLCLAAATTATAATSVLAPAGEAVTIDHPKALSIVIPEKATEQEKYAAAILSEYLGKMLSASLPILTEPQMPKGKIISVGNTVSAVRAGMVADPREQAYRLAVKDGSLYILGGSRGPLYGVIALLEEDFGCRRYAADAAPLIPALPGNQLRLVPRSYAPSFEIREPLYQEAFNTDWAAFNRLQPVSYFIRLPAAQGGGLANPNYFIHTYSGLVPADKYFKTHPEYFPLRNGKRHPSVATDGQLCYTCPGVVDVIVKELDGVIEKNPGTRVYSVSANDNVYDNCECPECQKIIKIDGVAGAQLNLANRVAEKLAKKYPDIKITTLAYVGSQIPPKTIRPGPNTVIFYAPIRQRYNPINMLEPIGDIKHIQDELAAWHKIASHIYLWDYVDYIDGALTPFPNFDALERGWNFLQRNGVEGVFLEASYRGRDSLAELKAWLYAKKLWNPQWPQDALIDEFIAAYYGLAAAAMKRYVALQRNAWKRFFGRTDKKQPLQFTPAEMAAMRKCLGKALDDCNGKAKYQERVKRERLSLASLFLSRNPRPATAAAYEKELKTAERLAEELQVAYFYDGGDRQTVLKQWHSKLLRAVGNTAIKGSTPGAIVVKKPLFPVAKYLPDANAATGEATRQTYGTDWGVQWPYGDFLDLLEPGKPYVVRMHCRPEWNARPPDGILFRMGYYCYGVGGGAMFPGKITEDKDKGYRWVNLFRLKVGNMVPTGYFYCTAGALIGQEGAVWYDYLELVPEKEFKDRAVAANLPLVEL